MFRFSMAMHISRVAMMKAHKVRLELLDHPPYFPRAIFICPLRQKLDFGGKDFHQIKISLHFLLIILQRKIPNVIWTLV